MKNSFKMEFKMVGKNDLSKIKPNAVGEIQPLRPVIQSGNTPRISRLMALAIRFEKLVRSEIVKDYADLAELGNVTRARVTQIMNMNLLAPEIQEELLFLPRTIKGRDPISEHIIRLVGAELNWNMQKKVWDKLKSKIMNEMD